MKKGVLDRALRQIESGWNQARLFAFNNRTIFELAFLSLYTAEQLILIWIVSSRNLQGQQLLNWVSYFALIVLFTFGLHKLIMESRIKLLEQEITNLGMQYWLAKHKSKGISEEYMNLKKAYNKLKREIARYINNKQHI